MPTPRLIAVFALLTVVAAVSVLVPDLRWIVLGCDALALAAFGVDLAGARSSRLSAHRRWPPMLCQGDNAEISVAVAAEGRRLAVVLREGLHPAVSDFPLRHRLEVDPRQLSVWAYRLDLRRRGVHRLLPLTARIEGPWGLAFSQRELLPAQEIRIYPQVRWEGRVGRLLALAHRHQLGLSPTALQGAGSEPYGVRRYAESDPPNRIHWKATARHGRLMAREETWEKSAHLVILLDCGRAMASMDGSRSKLDYALAAALALTRVACARGDRVMLIAFSDRIERRIRVRSGSRGIAQAYAEVYALEARLAEAAYDVAAETVRDAEFRRAQVVLLTSLADLAGAELLREALMALRRQHRPLLVHLEDPGIARMAFDTPETPIQAYAKVSALEILLGNRRLAARLRHAGIPTISTSADRLTLETLELYLRSAQGRSSARARSGHGGIGAGVGAGGGSRTLIPARGGGF